MLAVLIVGWMVYSSKATTKVVLPIGDKNATTSEQVAQNNETGTTVKGTQTFKSLITQKGSYKCTYEVASTTGRSTDIIYIADGRLRGEFRTTGMAGNLMIYDGVNLYKWKEGLTIGTKTPLKTLAQLPSIIPSDLTSGASYGSSLNSVGWDCHQWIKVSSLLIPPSSVKFTFTN